MIRFVDLTPWYWASDEPEDTSPCCAFICTVTDLFISHDGGHVFDCPEDVDAIGDPRFRERCRALVPDGFWEGK